jgi:probable rRNA maturation factor
MTAAANRSSSKRSRPLQLCVFVQNKAARNGVPLTRSFETWVRSALETRRQGRAEVNIVIVDAIAGRALNKQFRNKNYATNVLSFPYEPAPHERSDLLGDIVFCAPVVAREAAEQGKSLRDHYAHLTVHGTLHLLGYDHMNDADAQRMEMLERRILEQFGIADPY